MYIPVVKQQCCSVLTPHDYYYSYYIIGYLLKICDALPADNARTEMGPRTIPGGRETLHDEVVSDNK